MKLYFFSLLAIFFLLLSDPDGSGSCGGCNSYITEVGVLPDTALTIDSKWEVNIKERLWVGNGSCDGGYFGPYAPQISLYTSNTKVQVTQQDSMLFIEAIEQGISEITFVTGAGADEGPEIFSQTIRVAVK